MPKMQYFCARPQLAERLMRHGYTAEQTINPWSPSRAAWRFDITPKLAAFIKAFYANMRKPRPNSTERAFKKAGVTL